MRFRSPTLFAVLALAVPGLPARAAEKKADNPALVVRVNSIDALIADLRVLADEAGLGEEAKGAEGILRQFIGPQGLEGFDTKKPFALYGRLAAKIEESDLVVMVPVADEKKVMELLRRQEVKAEKDDNDVYKVDVPGLPFGKQAPVYFRFANGYAYVSPREAKMLAKERLLAPAVLPGQTSMLEIVLDLDRIPEGFKDMIIGQASLRLSEAKGEKQPGEPESFYKFRVAAIDELAGQIKAVVNEGKDLTLKLGVDKETAEVVASLRFTPKPGTKLADGIADLGKGESLLANLTGPDSALNARLFLTMPQALLKPYNAFLDDAFKMGTAAAPNEEARKLHEQVFKAIGPTLRAGVLDQGISLRGPSAKGLYTAVGGLAVKDGEEIDKVLHAAHPALPGPVQALIKLDAEKAAGVNIHRISPPEDKEKIDPNFKRIFGDGPGYVAVRKDALLIAAGEHALEAMKDVLGRGPKAGRVIDVEASVARLVPLSGKEDAVAVAKKVFGKKPDDDRVRLTLEGGKALELRLSAKAKLLDLVFRLEQSRKKDEQ
jgi:hypothetical protein